MDMTSPQDRTVRTTKRRPIILPSRGTLFSSVHLPNLDRRADFQVRLFLGAILNPVLDAAGQDLEVHPTCGRWEGTDGLGSPSYMRAEGTDGLGSPSYMRARELAHKMLMRGSASYAP